MQPLYDGWHILTPFAGYQLSVMAEQATITFLPDLLTSNEGKASLAHFKAEIEAD